MSEIQKAEWEKWSDGTEVWRANGQIVCEVGTAHGAFYVSVWLDHSTISPFYNFDEAKRAAESAVRQTLAELTEATKEMEEKK